RLAGGSGEAMGCRAIFASWSILLLGAGSALAQNPYVKVSDRSAVERSDQRPTFNVQGAYRPLQTAACDLAGLAYYGEAVPEGGTLASISFADGATISPSGQIAFVSRINGVERNQGVFVAGKDGLIPIVIGCGGGGGSGDPGSGCGD